MGAAVVIFGHVIYREKPGVLSEGPCWVCWYGQGCWGHFCDGFWELIWNVITEYKHDRHLIG